VVTFLRCIRKLAISDCELRHVCLSVRPSVRLFAWNNSAPIGQIFMKFDISVFFENLPKKIPFD